MFFRFGQGSASQRSATKTLMPMILAGSLVTACSSNTSAPQPQFWDLKDSRVNNKLSTSQEADSVAAARYLSQVIDMGEAFTPIAHADALLFANLMTSSLETQAGGSDSVLSNELEKCVRRKFTLSERGTNTVKIWYDNAEGHVCPIEFTVVETTQSDSSSRNGESVGSRSVAISFAAKEITRQYDEGKVRRLNLAHSENFYQLESKHNPGAHGLRKLTQTVKGSMEMGDTSTVSFGIEHSTDITTTRVDDTTETYSGRDLMTITVGMPFGTHALSFDTVYTPYSRTPTTRIVVNGVDLKKN